MARHEVVIHQNTGALAATAPYIGSYIAKETLRMSAFATAIGNRCGLPAIQVMAILSGAFEVLQRLERAVEDRDHLDRGQPALRADGGRERGQRQRLLGDVVAEIRRNGTRRARVLVDHNFMSSHFL